jgi:DNA-binding NarL/FixJ family response regulator
LRAVTKLRLVLVDDHDLFRMGIRGFLVSSPRFEVVGEARAAREAFPIIASARPDVILMDIALPGMDGVIATRELLRRAPQTRVVMLSAHAHSNDVLDAMDAGALGYVVKADPLEYLLQALEHVSRGDRYVAPSVAAYLPSATARPSHVLDVLSEREHEVFRLAADCRTSAEIARELCLARKTVDTHLNHINRKLDLHDRAALVRLAVDLGLVHSIWRSGAAYGGNVALTIGPAEDRLRPQARRPAHHRPPDAVVVQDRRALEAARA